MLSEGDPLALTVLSISGDGEFHSANSEAPGRDILSLHFLPSQAALRVWRVQDFPQPSLSRTCSLPHQLGRMSVSMSHLSYLWLRSWLIAMAAGRGSPAQGVYLLLLINWSGNLREEAREMGKLGSS